MNERDRQYFDALYKDRSDSADNFEKPSIREMWRSIVEKYSDQAHFIYELIQNADDAGATDARFILEPDCLIFAHNGVRQFSISNPENEDIDSKNGNLGDINAITGIAFSNKSMQENKIGKFGVGFKAVFQYTATPHIYDPGFRFRIDRYIVPSQIDEDFPERKPNETLFVFPFDHKDKNPHETYIDIENKLKGLLYPTLFLKNLLDISFKIGSLLGSYEKSIVEEYEFNDATNAEKISLTQNLGNDKVTKSLWLFTRYCDEFKYSVGFFTDANSHLIPESEPAFCFFPTKETTGLQFLIHAPFSLTDNREGIRAGIKHNNNLIALLAKLAGASLLHLRDIGKRTSKRIIGDDVFSIIPMDKKVFCEIDDRNKISFMPFFLEIKQIFATQEIIPTRTGFTIAKNAYWAAVPYLAELFNDAQLAEICNNLNAKWAFASLGRDEVQRNNKAVFDYIDAITFSDLNEDFLIRGRLRGYFNQSKDIKGITPEFIEKQNLEWLCTFYKWLSETTHRTDLAKVAPIFLDQDSKAVSAYDDNEHLILFLPSGEISGYRTIREDLLTNKDACKLIKKLGITYPSIRDHIYNVILPQYEKDDDIDNTPHFAIFFKYYRQCPQEDVDEFLDEIREYEFITYYTKANTQACRGKAEDLYLPTKDLIEYFETKPTTRFVAYDEYLSFIGLSNEKHLKSFLIELGVKQFADVYDRELDFGEVRSRKDLPKPYATSNITYSEKCIDGCKEVLAYITQNKSKEKSIMLWKQLLLIIANKCKYGKFDYLMRGTCRYFYYSNKSESFTSFDANLLKSSKWLLSHAGDFVKPSELTLSALSDVYNIEDENALVLLNFLSITENDKILKLENDSNLTDIQRKKIELADLASNLEISLERAKELLYEEAKRQAKFAQIQGSGFPHTSVTSFDKHSKENDNENKEPHIDTNMGISVKHSGQATSRIVEDILSRTKLIQNAHEESLIESNEDIDEDEYTPSPIDFSHKVEQEKDKTAKEIDRITYQEDLQQRALGTEKYSYGWFKALLELEILNSNINNQNSKEISISFTRVEREQGTQRILVLKHPNKFIPQFLEDLADISLVLHFFDQTKTTLAIEVVNVKSYTLRVKLQAHIDITDLDFSKIAEARIDTKSPVFLLEELRKQFLCLGYDNDFNMQENLCENIEFVFGPPGTGKTTHLVENVIMPFIKDNEKIKILVLTPTNKSADVLVKRIMDVMRGDTTYNEWLVRFGGTCDDAIEQSLICREKTFEIRNLSKNVVVTTIARFPYDFFMPQGARVFLNGINWDYIIIDEASMIPLIDIIYPLYKKTPQKFIIAGDPFQIEPITSVDLWKNENIYAMVKLDSFIEPQTVPHDYKVVLLTTQYRSIPSVGSVFSKFTYGGILKHYRKEIERKSLNIEFSPDVGTLNIIKFPVSKYESIFRSKRLQHRSSYQIYSALFVFEFVSYLAKSIACSNRGDFFRIGIITPYKAQADLIEKLFCSESFPAEVKVQVGTIHAFQGDECDIIFAVFNTPPSITSTREMFLNKRNIINVSISRAKDYLFIVMPDDDTENINNLYLMKKVEQIIKNSDSYTETRTADLEKIIFGSTTYLEDNSFSTGHQSVNVYGLPEKCYEIRSEDTAIDVQVHRSVNKESVIDTAMVRQNAIDYPILQFTWLEEKGELCLVDKAPLQVSVVEVYKKNGVQKKLNMHVCSHCGRRYLIRGALPDSINLLEYCVSEKQLPSNSSSELLVTPVKKTDSVFSNKYGDGEIISREKKDGFTIITVRFSDAMVKYYEEIAFNKKSLIRKQ